VGKSKTATPLEVQFQRMFDRIIGTIKRIEADRIRFKIYSRRRITKPLMKWLVANTKRRADNERKLRQYRDRAQFLSDRIAAAGRPRPPIPDLPYNYQVDARWNIGKPEE